MEEITIKLSEFELSSIIFCLNLRADSDDIAPEWKDEYKKLADKLQTKIAEND